MKVRPDRVPQIYPLLFTLLLGGVIQGEKHDHKAVFPLVLEKTPSMKQSSDLELTMTIRAF